MRRNYLFETRTRGNGVYNFVTVRASLVSRLITTYQNDDKGQYVCQIESWWKRRQHTSFTHCVWIYRIRAS